MFAVGIVMVLIGFIIAYPPMWCESILHLYAYECVGWLPYSFIAFIFGIIVITIALSH